MQKAPDDIDVLLPFGESLRGFLEQPFIAPADLKHTLRSRGVFLSRNEKRDTIPTLVCLLLCPREFDELRECQSSREDNPKQITRALPWASRKSLLDALSLDVNLSNLLAGDFTNYRIVGSPSFVPVANNPNNICCEFEIEREDYSKSWAATKSIFKGKLQLEKNHSGTVVKFILTHTAAETKEVNRRFVRELTERFKRNGDVKNDAEVETILFASFDNELRIAFFRSLMKNLLPAGFEFVSMTDFGACPDRLLELPAGINWMEDKVDGMAINGRALEDIFFLKDTEYHKFILLYAVEAKFKFDCGEAKGTCSVVFEFPDFMPGKDGKAEFEANISALSIDPASSQLNRTLVKEELLRRVNEFKLTQFEKFKLRPLNIPAVQLETAMDWGSS